MTQPLPFRTAASIGKKITTPELKPTRNLYFSIGAFLFLFFFSVPLTGQNCPDVSAPVCGSNGVTYLNSCYAEAAGITTYTAGVCFDFCIIPQNFEDDSNCSTDFNPVCGCNGVTYLNQCVAQANGISNFFFGICESNCVDAERIGNLESINISNEGVLTVDCPTNYDPVCGCNGITYSNPCFAESAGVISYTPGICTNACLRAVDIDPDMPCSQDYDPVCACNGEIYPNACMAEAAGIQDYDPGYCGQGSSWCNEATILNCGDFLANETTLGSGNQIISYQGCNSSTFLGPDRVYIINKNMAGDLQIGMEILTPNLDLDIFLLDGTCSQVECLAASTTSNTLTNNEGIILEDAPVGTYFLIVDAQFAGAQGNYNLEISCGYLSCIGAVPLTCGEPYQGNNVNGSDNASLYSCEGNVLNVENNGPEIVHTFTTTDFGPVDINLTDLSANLELFLLRSCDRGACIDFSQNPGINNESISANLPAGTYFVVVDGFNGATSDYTLQVDCNSDCAIELTNLISTPTDCGENNGKIEAQISGGTPAYLVSWSGPLSGSNFIQNNNLEIGDLPTGVYTIRIADSNGCIAETSVTVESVGGMTIDVNAVNAICDGTGALEISIDNGIPDFRINITGTLVTNIDSQSDFYVLDNLPPGPYNVFVMDNQGCSASQMVVIGEDPGDFEVEATGNEASCEGLGSITVMTNNGSPVYDILLSGPVSGSGSSAGDNFEIINLPAGLYTLTVIDDEGCSVTQSVEIEVSGDLAFETQVQNGDCSENGIIFITINSGSPSYTISYDGPSSGQITTNQSQLSLFNLPGGTYTITIEDAGGCLSQQVATITVGDELELTITPAPEACGQTGFIFIEIDMGISPFNLTWSGPSSGSEQFTVPEFLIQDLTAGIYEIQISDAAGCSFSGTYFVEQEEEVIIETVGNQGLCGETGSIDIDILSGGSPYVITWSGPAFGSISTTSDSYTINQLPPGDYLVEVTDAFDCVVTQQVELLPSLDDLTIETTVFENPCGETGAILVEMESGTSPYILTWNGPSSGVLVIDTDSYLIDNLEEGVYTIEVSDVSNCFTSEFVDVQNDLPGFQIGAFVEVGLCGQNGSIQLNFANGQGPFMVGWDGPVFGQQNVSDNFFEIDDLPSGVYEVRVQSSNGCFDIIDATLQNQEDNMVLNAGPSIAPCGELGGFNFQVLEGTPPYTLNWSGPESGSQVFQTNSFNISGLESGTYAFSITDINGCDADNIATLNNVENNIIISATPLNGACGADAVVLIEVDAGSPSYEIEWNGPLPGIIFTDQNSFTISMLEGGLYEFIVTDALGCTDTTIITVGDTNGMLDANLQLNNNVCSPIGSIDIDFLEGSPPYLITWNGPLTGQFTTNTDEYSIMDLISGDYTITIEDITGCDNTFEVELLNADSAPNILSETQVGDCGVAGQITLTLEDNAPNYTIEWGGPSSGSAQTQNDVFTIDDLQAGQYSISVTNNNGCQYSTNTLLEEGSPELSLSLQTNPGACGESGSIDLLIDGGQGNYTITWTGTSSGSETISGNSFTLPNLIGGNYTFQIEDVNNCTDTQSVTLDNSSEPISFDAQAIDGVCEAFGSILLDIESGTAPFEISWAGANNGSENTNDPNFEIPNLPEGDYIVTVLDAQNCQNTMAASVEITSLPPVVSVEASVVDCGELGAIEVTIQGAGSNFQINWNGPSNGTVSTDQSSYQIEDLPAGDYIIEITDDNGCTDTDQASVQESTPAVSAQAETFPGACGELGSLSLSISGGTPGFNINWSGPISGSDNTNDNTFLINDLPTGTYNILISDNNNCSDQFEIEIENGDDELNFNAQGNAGFCGQPGSIGLEILTGLPPFSITWTGPLPGFSNTSENTFEISNLPTGTYIIQISDAVGCNSITSASVMSTQDNLSLLLNPITGLCGELGSVNILIDEGVPGFDISWSGPVNGSAQSDTDTYQITDLPAGSYIIDVVDVNGCDDTQSIMVETSPTLEFTTTSINGDCIQEGFIIVDIAAGDQTYTINWDGPESGTATSQTALFNIPDLASGDYLIEVIDQNGCNATQNALVQNMETDLAVSTTEFNGNCGELGFILVEISGGDSDYTITWDGPSSGSITIGTSNYTIPDLSSGNYQINITDNSGCQNNTNSIISNGQGELSVNTQAMAEDCDQPGLIVVEIGAGQGPFQINWDGPENGSEIINETNYTIINLDAGEYTVNVVDANDCSIVEVLNVDLINQNPDAIFGEDMDVLSVIFDNGSTPGNYFWDFGDGTTSTDVNPTHTYCEEGVFTVCLTVDNICGSDELCTDLNLAIPDDVVILNVGEELGMNGETILVPVTMEHNDVLASVSGSFQAVDPSVVFITGIQPGIIMPQFMASNLTFSFLDLLGNGIPVMEGDTLFFIEMIITGNPGESTDLMIVDDPLMIEVGGVENGNAVVKPSVALKGQVTVLGNGNLTGQITTFWGEGIQDVNVDFESINIDDSDITDLSGNYILPNVPLGESYAITPEKDINPLNGLSTYALFVGQQFLLGMDPQLIYSPYQIIGGNSNCDDNFSTLDLFITQQLLVGQIDIFSSCPSWVFIPQDFPLPNDFNATNVFPYETSDTIFPINSTSTNFIGVKIGDIIGQANPAQFQSEEEENRSNEKLHLVYNNQSIEAGEEFVLNIRSTDFEDVVSYQFGLFFDSNKLNFLQFTPSEENLLNSVVVGASDAAEGNLRLSWFSTTGHGLDANESTSLFQLRFEALENIEDIASYLRLSPQFIRGEAYDGLGLEREIILSPENLTSSEELDKVAFKLYQNRPNPFSNQTLIGFELPTQMTAEIIIQNHLGELIQTYRDTYRQGYNKVELTELNLPGGIYYYTLKAGDFSSTKKMILIPD